jgi:23S rRNA (adenine-N6)-dimethyltransferase
VAAPARGHDDRSASGQHFLRSPRLAAELVAAACVREEDLVVEIGAGFGRLTVPLARSAGSVIAVERDPDLADGLRRRFARGARVVVAEADVFALPLPETPYRAFGNLPFSRTSAILRRLLDDPSSHLLRADLIVELGVARKVSSARPSSMRSLGWLPWWQFELGRHIPSAAFDPRPSVDAALLSVQRRDPPLLEPATAERYRGLLRGAFDRAPAPLRRSLGLPPRTWKRLARDRGLAVDARPQHLDVWDWIAVLEEVS